MSYLWEKRNFDLRVCEIKQYMIESHDKIFGDDGIIPKDLRLCKLTISDAFGLGGYKDVVVNLVKYADYNHKFSVRMPIVVFEEHDKDKIIFWFETYFRSELKKYRKEQMMCKMHNLKLLLSDEKLMESLPLILENLKLNMDDWDSFVENHTNY